MDANELATLLRLNWNRWHDVDRGEAIVALRNAGISLRGLARFVGCSEGLIRHLEIVGNAPPPRQGRVERWPILDAYGCEDLSGIEEGKVRRALRVSLHFLKADPGELTAFT